MDPALKMHIRFSAANAPTDPNGRRGAEFWCARTWKACVEAAFMDVHGRAFKGAHGKHNPALQCLSGATTASVGKKSNETPTPTGSGSPRNLDRLPGDTLTPDAMHNICSRTRSPTRGWSPHPMLKVPSMLTGCPVFPVFLCRWGTNWSLVVWKWARMAAATLWKPRCSRSWWTLHHPYRELPPYSIWACHQVINQS
jgi:hypothetical protein